MTKKYLLIIIIFSILVISGLYWYLNYQLPKTTPTPSVEEVKEVEKVEEVMEETTETEETEAKGTKSIPLEKPPFIKD